LSILVDLYNLKLTGNPESDKDKVINFLSKYAPQVTRYLTASEIELKLKEGAVDAGEIGGTLGYYEKINGRSWFQSWFIEQTKIESRYYNSFYLPLYELTTAPVVDNYLEGRDTTNKIIIMVGSLLDNIRISQYCQNEQGQEFSDTWVPESIDPSKYTFHEHKVFTTELTKGEPALGGMKYHLFQEIHSLWNREIEIGHCQLEGCKNIFIIRPSGKTQKYCSNAHIVKAFREIKKELLIM
jgi:hypothetical protein